MKNNNNNTPLGMLAEPQVCVLATVNADGTAHAMPMWYLYEDDALWFMSGGRSRKVRNVERTGKATVALDRRSPPYYAVMVYADATIGPALDPARKRRLVRRYLDDAATDRYIAQTADDAANSVSIALAPTKFVEFHGRAGRD